MKRVLMVLGAVVWLPLLSVFTGWISAPHTVSVYAGFAGLGMLGAFVVWVVLQLVRFISPTGRIR